MASYAIIANGQDIRPCPCWIIDATSAEAALREAWDIRDAGRMPWLPTTSIFTARKASRLERRWLTDSVKIRPTGLPSLNGDDLAHRIAKLESAFFERLWREKQKAH